MKRRAASPADPLESDFYRFGLTPDGHYRFAHDELPAGIRMIGSGDVGGKARGLIYVMRAVEDGHALSPHDELLRFPDSVVLTTEIFDCFVKENDLRVTVQAGCEGRITLEELVRRIVDAEFPAAWLPSLAELLEREERPLAVRSSSVMEDDPDHSYAGIYLSHFVANRGTLDDRLNELIVTIKRIYASTFAPNARAYRKRHGLDWHQEKMAVLIQNMIGAKHPLNLFYPLVGGVAFSRNYYPWTRRLRPEDGIVRLVVGTGTRAVGREYARVYAPRLPGLRPEGSDSRAIVRYSQETVDVLDLTTGRLAARRLDSLENPLLTKVCSILAPDGTLREPPGTGLQLVPGERFLASFYRLIEKNGIMPFTAMMTKILKRLERLIGFAVDIEFAIEFASDAAQRAGSPLLYLLQARPLGNRERHRSVRIPRVDRKRTILVSRRVLGNGKKRGIRHLLLVEPASYRWDKAHQIARAIGAINDRLVTQGEPYILIGPGRWGSSNPQLGIPVQYGEISGAVVLVEMSTDTFTAELSYGTHFYADMVAAGVLHLPLDEAKEDMLNRELLDQQEIVEQDEFVTHYAIADTADVFVDGEHRRGLIALRTRRRGGRAAAEPRYSKRSTK